MATITGIVTHTERRGSTVNGNPIIDATLSTATEGFPGIVKLRVSHDSSLSYEIENIEHRGTPYVFELTRSGRLAYELGEWDK